MSLVGNKIIGVRREDKNKWERRVDQGVRVLVQPSGRRVFPDQLYEEAGAELVEDLSGASTILAVKEVPIELLIPERTYVFFSHTIKAQPSNMPLLDALLEKRIRLIDYECITEGGERGGKRLVAFGRYAGLAGAIDFCRGLGERLLTLGYSTPFLNIGATFMYPSVEEAKAALRTCGETIARFGLPRAVGPFIVVFTGRGNVSQGAQEVWKLLPHKYVSVEELPELVDGDFDPRVVYLCEVGRSSMVHRRGAPEGEPLDADHYQEHPKEYEPIFHRTVAPYASVIMNCMYWDQRFPRLLTIAQTQELQREGRLRLIGVGDITCDFEGSIEFLKEFTSIEDPYYIFDLEASRVVHSMDHPSGILFHAVDHLPSECPREASEHFSSRLTPLLPALAVSDGTKDLQQSSDYEATDLPMELAGAVVTSKGHLTDRFRYISHLREAHERAERGRARGVIKTHARRGPGASPAASPTPEASPSPVPRDREGDATSAAPPSMMATSSASSSSAVTSRPRGLRRQESFLSMRLVGHLFDNSVINRVLDLVETSDASVRIMDFSVGKDRFTPTDISLQVFAPSGEGLTDIVGSIHRTAEALQCRVEILGEQASSMVPRAGQAHAGGSGAAKRILLLGAGMVTPPLVDYLLRRPNNRITVAAMFLHEAEALCKPRPADRMRAVQLDVSSQPDKLEELLREHHVVISLVPAQLHPVVAEAAIRHGVNVVTASYVSPAMQALDQQARDAGVVVLNEMGVDPGIDHMSALKTIHEAKEDGYTVESFKSNCGGLPAPEAAHNPLGYKFSWSPRGLLVAANNAAKFREHGEEVNVPGKYLLASANPFRLHWNPSLALEVLPNRDSTVYAPLYDLSDAATFFRGTLRYEGFSLTLLALAALGLIDPNTEQSEGGCGDPTLHATLLRNNGAVSSEGKVTIALQRWLAHSLGLDPSSPSVAVQEAVGQRIVAFLEAGGRPAPNATNMRRAMDCLRWLGFLHPEGSLAVEPGQPDKAWSPLDITARVLSQHPDMNYGAEERDMVVMQHEFVLRRGSECLRRTATLLEYAAGPAQPGYTAMAKTVGFTSAIAAQMILDGSLHETGVLRPMIPDVFLPIVDALEHEGIVFREEDETLPADFRA